MPLATLPAPAHAHPTCRCPIALKASRPSLIDLRFKGDAWVVGRGHVASVCLGDYPLGHVAASPFDLPTFNRVLEQVRTGQARRNYIRRLRSVV